MDVKVVGAAAAVPQQTPPVATPQDGQTGTPGAPQGGSSGALSPVVAQIFGNGGLPKPISVDVSYRVSHDPNIIVTVFTDPKTGQEIAQVPPEIMVQIAQFFDKHSGVTLDRSA